MLIVAMVLVVVAVRTLLTGQGARRGNCMTVNRERVLPVPASAVVRPVPDQTGSWWVN